MFLLALRARRCGRRLGPVGGRRRGRGDVLDLRGGRLRRLGGGAVLLVDDLVDSRWTLTVAARALRRAGSGPVLPFVLASRG